MGRRREWPPCGHGLTNGQKAHGEGEVELQIEQSGSSSYRAVWNAFDVHILTILLLVTRLMPYIYFTYNAFVMIDLALQAHIFI